MAIDIWWYDSRGCWCADVPTKEGRKRLYLGEDEKKARAERPRRCRVSSAAEKVTSTVSWWVCRIGEIKVAEHRVRYH